MRRLDASRGGSDAGPNGEHQQQLGVGAKSRSRWTTQSGAWTPLTYVLLDVVAVVSSFIVYVILEVIEPRQVVMVTATLYTHSYAWHKDSVPSWAVPLYAIGAPLVAFLVWKFVERRRLVTWYDWYRTFMCLLFVLFLTGAVTNCLKVAIARPRPNWFYQCWPNGTIVWQPGTQNDFGGMPQCVDESNMPEYRKSFPSGHSSWSAAGLGFLSYWMLGQLGTFVGTGAPHMWSFLVSMVPFLSAIVVGVSRITDRWHNVSDVCFGLLLGYGIALACYLQLYPWFTREVAFVPRWVLMEQQRARKSEDEPEDMEAQQRPAPAISA